MELSIKNLMKPLVTALGKEHEKEALEIIGKEESGVLAWGVRSGYLLWTRQNPGGGTPKILVKMCISARLF